MKKLYYIVVFLTGLGLYGCAAESSSSTNTEVKGESNAQETPQIAGETKAAPQPKASSGKVKSAPSSSFPANSPFTESEKILLSTIKSAFDQRIQSERPNVSLEEAYSFHALGLRLEMLNEGALDFIPPYDGSMSLEEIIKNIEATDVLTRKCGFTNEKENGETVTVNYYCLSAANNLIDYYQKEDDGGELIDRLLEAYVNNKSYTPEIRQSFLLNAKDDIDFSAYGGQVFYALFHLLLNEEVQAYKKMSLRMGES